MDNKLSKLLSIYFLVAGLAALMALAYLFSIPANESHVIMYGVSARYFVVELTALALVLATGISITLAYFSWRKSSKIYHRIESLLSKKSWIWGIFLIAMLIFLAGVWVTLSPPIRLVIFIRIQPVLVWLMFMAFLTILCQTNLHPSFIRYPAAVVFAFTINLIIVHAVQIFFFPLESYWLWIAAGLLLYSLTETILVQSGRVKNIFCALDQEKVELKDVVLIFAGPTILALILAVSGRGYIFFLLPVLWLTCGLQAFLASGIAVLWERIWLPGKRSLSLRSLLWFVSAILVLWIYYMALISINTYTQDYPGLLPLSIYPHENPLLQGDPTIRGIWYTIPTEKSNLYPLGYARLEDSAGDDPGHPFFAVLGSLMGFIQPCNSPFPDMAKAVPGSGTNTVPPRFNYTFDTLCPEWAATLPQFYWRIGLLGVLLISIVFGVVILRDPVGFFVLAVVMLIAWGTWPASRPGQVEFLLFGMPCIMLLPYIIRHGRTSMTLGWSLFCGLVAGVAGFVRSPSGMALLFAGALAIVVLAGIKKKKLLLATCMLLALLAGNQIVPTILNGVFWYRDTRLQIAAPKAALGAHIGAGVNMLGGIGGAYFSNGKILYPNALDLTHWDPIILLNLQNENPLMAFALNAPSAASSVADKIIVNYVLRHPLQFAIITSQKAYKTLYMLIEIPVNWLQVSLTLAILGSLGLFIKRALASWISPVFDNDSGGVAGETLILCFTLAAISAVPAILTDPIYYQSIYPAAAVLFITIQVALYEGVFHRLAHWIK